jgi:aminopeptidase N
MASANFDAIFYRCSWQIDPAVRAISGNVLARFRMTATSNFISLDFSDTLVVDSVLFHNHPIGFQRLPGDELRINFPVSLNNDTVDSTTIFYHGVPRLLPSFNPFIFTRHSGTPGMYTLSEPYGPKEWWPCKNGLDDKADSIEIFIRTPLGYRGTANGMVLEETSDSQFTIVHLKHRFPIASYLIAIAATNYQTRTDSVNVAGRMLPLVLNAYPEDAAGMQVVNNVAAQCITRFSSLFGPYPFLAEQYAQTEVSVGGGMENQTNTFITGTWNQLVAHELGHHWFGDHVTCGSWQDIWLNEGFANYMQFIFVENFASNLIIPHLLFYRNQVLSQPGGSVFVPDTSDPARIFDARLTYAKGGYVVHMLRGVLGDSAFFRGIRQYLNDPRVSGGFARTADLQRNLEAAGGLDLSVFFRQWVYGEGYPTYSAVWTQNKNQYVHLTLHQTSSHPSVPFYQMPVQIEFRNKDRDTVLTVNNTFNGQSFQVNPGFIADTVLIDPKYWILAAGRTTSKLPAPSDQTNDIRIFPNPASAYLQVRLYNPSVRTIQMKLFSANGQLVYNGEKKLNGQDESFTIPVFGLSNGNYVLRVNADGDFLVAKKILVTR